MRNSAALSRVRGLLRGPGPKNLGRPLGGHISSSQVFRVAYSLYVSYIGGRPLAERQRTILSHLTRRGRQRQSLEESDPEPHNFGAVLWLLTSTSTGTSHVYCRAESRFLLRTCGVR